MHPSIDPMMLRVRFHQLAGMKSKFEWWVSLNREQEGTNVVTKHQIYSYVP